MKLFSICLTGIFLLSLNSGVFAQLPGRPDNAGTSTLTLPGEDVPDAIGAPSVPGPLTIPGEMTKPNVPNVAFYDFGVMGMPTTKPIRHDFIVHNSSDAPVMIDRVEPGCDCTTASIGSGEAGPHLLGPQQNLTVHVTVDSSQLYIGKINKFIWIYLSGQSGPAFTLHVIGHTIPIARFSPQMLDFKPSHPGATVAAKLTVTTEISAYGIHPPSPFSTGGKLKIVPTGARPVIAGGRVSRIYKVILPTTAKPGLFNDVIAEPLQNGTREAGPSILITGTVLGPVSGTPKVSSSITSHRTTP